MPRDGGKTVPDTLADAKSDQRARWARVERARDLRKRADKFRVRLMPSLLHFTQHQPVGQASGLVEHAEIVDGVLERFVDGRPEVSAQEVNAAYDGLLKALREADVPLERGSRGAYLMNELYWQILGISEFLAAGEGLPIEQRQAEFQPLFQASF